MNKLTIAMLLAALLGLSACSDSKTASNIDPSSSSDTEQTDNNQNSTNSASDSNDEQTSSDDDANSSGSDDNQSDNSESEIEKNIDIPSFKLNQMHESRSLQGNISADNWAYDIKEGSDTRNLQFEIKSNSNSSLFEKQPEISYPSGTLRYSTKASSGGEAKLVVALHNKETGKSSEALETTIKINAAPINKAPSFKADGENNSLNTDGFIQFKNWATDFNDNNPEADQGMHFEIVSNTNSDLFTVTPKISYPSGTLRYKAKPNAEGTAKITIILVDDTKGTYGGSNKSAPYSFNINIAKPVPKPKPVNHAPSFDNKGDQSSKDTAGAVEIAGWAYNISDGDGNTQNLSFEIVSNSNPSLFAVQPSLSYPSGTLRYTPKEGSEGSATLSVRLKDDGGTSNGGMDVSENTAVTFNIEKMNNNGLPPDPGEEGKKTILGVDSNANGIRDDIEIELYYLYEYDIRIRNVLYAMSKGDRIEFELYLSGDFERAKLEKDRNGDLIECLIGSDNPHKDLQTLELLTANTPDRFSTYWDLNDSMAAYYNDEIRDPIDCGVYE